MSNQSIVQLRGTITKLRDSASIGIFFLTLLDDQKQLVTISYDAGSDDIKSTLFGSLPEGMAIEISVEGPVVSTKSVYRGIGIIKISN